MDPSKSQVCFYVDLLELMLRCNPCSAASSKSLERDVLTLRQRTTFEGLSFLTKTLPKLGKAFDLGLTSTLFKLPREFRCSHDNTNIPAFMQAYFNNVFDAHGVLREDADPAYVQHVRQVLYFAYKLALPFQKDQIASTLDAFISTDGELKLSLDDHAEQILAFASIITEDIFSDFDVRDISPRHGPGAVATGERLEHKWTFARLYNCIHQMFPYYDYFVVGGARELIDRLDWYKSLRRLDQGTAKVILVPKDSRGPRLISCEPLEFQWIQQGIGRGLVRHLESHPATRGQINFTYQSVNQELALSSSLDDQYSTLDLKDASDRVSLALVERVFEKTPLLLRGLLAARTSATKLPDGRVVSLNKYAPMGSALCFPTEAYVFWVLLVAAISRRFRLSRHEVGRLVYVYGDDIILPRDMAHYGIQSLEYFSLLVNRDKCCIQGPFRESCGTDAFKGVFVTPLRLRSLWSGRRSDGTAYASYVSLANALYAKGYKMCSDFLWKELEKTYGVIPFGTSQAAYPCKIVISADEAEELNSSLFRRRYSSRYQRFEFLMPRLSVRRKKTKLDGWLRMLRDLLSPSYEDPSTVVIPRSTLINRGWTPVY